MAKNKIEIDVKVDDKGTTKKVALESKKASEALGKTGKSARTADRNLKGAAQASANSTKNFSKMAQGISGGLVPAYAALAAQIFALTAAFNFLKRAADFENLRQSQLEFAASTGTGLRTITERIKQASNGMLGFQEAAQAAAIGGAKGFSAGQLTKLAEGAGKAARALGINYEEAFSRLVRGVSKAEPELLDELGITLRLEEATNRYAAALGVNVKTLTTAQRSQAVYNETLRQLDQNFGAINVGNNAFVQLSKTFEEIQQKITGKVLPLFISLADAINKNAEVAIAAFTALGAFVLLNIDIFKNAILGLFTTTGGVLVGTVSIAKKISSTIGTGLVGVLSPVVEELEEAEEKLQNLATETRTRAQQGAKVLLDAGAKSKTLEKLSLGEKVSPQALGKLKSDLERVRQEIKETGETASKAFAGATVESIEKVQKELKDLTRTGLTAGEKLKKMFAKGVVKSINAVRTAANYATIGLTYMGKAGKKATGLITGGFRAIGRATIFIGILQTAVELFDKLSKYPETFVNNLQSGLARIISTFGKFINFIIKGLNTLAKAAGASGDLISKTTFGERSAEIAKSMVDFGLDVVDISREDLKIAENKAKKEEERKALQEERLTKIREEAKIIQAILEDIKAFESSSARNDPLARARSFLSRSPGELAGLITSSQENNRDVQRIAAQSPQNASAQQEAINSLYLLANLRKAAEDTINLFPRLTSEVAKQTGIVLDENTPLETLATFLQEVERIGGKDVSDFAGGIASVSDEANNLQNTLRSGNLTQVVDEINKEVKKFNDLVDTEKRLLGSSARTIQEYATQYEKGMQGLLQTRSKANALLEEQNRIEANLNNLAIGSVLTGPGAVGRQQDLAMGAERDQLLLEQKINALKQYEFAQSQLIEKDEVAYQAEVQRRTNEINLLKEKARVSKQNMTEVGQIVRTIGDSLASSMQSAFDGLIQGTMNAKQAFASMAKSMLQAIAKVISELLVAKLLTATLGGTGFGNFLGIPKTRTGGILEPSMRRGGIAEPSMRRGGIAESYATGGIARGRDAGYPAILHGTEAVVPLPNGKEIPVKMMNGGQSNNVVVNVNVDSNGNAQQNGRSDAAGGMNLGNAIAAAVQKELQNQKRSGGILNPYGAA